LKGKNGLPTRIKGIRVIKKCGYLTEKREKRRTRKRETRGGTVGRKSAVSWKKKGRATMYFKEKEKV